MRVKEVRISDTDRFVICHNPEAAERDRHMREQLVTQLADLIADTDKLSDFKRGELRGRIADKPGLNRYLRACEARKVIAAGGDGVRGVCRRLGCCRSDRLDGVPDHPRVAVRAGRPAAPQHGQGRRAAGAAA
nr:hypothetical protein [Streptacidiphilus pinicola]